MNKTATLSERKRADIMEAALSEFIEKGFRAMSMDALSARAGVSKRTVYNHFDSKEALFKAIAQQLFDLCEAMDSINYEPGRPLAEQLTEYAQNKLRFFQSERVRDLSKIVVAECIYTPQLSAKALQQFNEKAKGLDTWINDAIADGKLREVDSSYAATQFIGLIKANAFWPQLMMDQPFPNNEQCQFLIEDTVNLFLNHYAI